MLGNVFLAVISAKRKESVEGQKRPSLRMKTRLRRFLSPGQMIRIRFQAALMIVLFVPASSPATSSSSTLRAQNASRFQVMNHSRNTNYD
jgi:hypothetical protein